MPKATLDDVLVYLRKMCALQASRELADGELLKRFAAERDEAAFSALVRRHGPAVLGVCKRVLGDEHGAEDAFQGVFLVLVRRAKTLTGNQPLGGWLYTVAQRVAAKAKRQAAARRKRERRVANMPRREPVDDLAWEELRSVLDEEMARLPEKYRTPLVLCYFEGQSQVQAAKELGVPATSLTSRVERGRELLRQRLVRRGITLSAGALATALAERAGGTVLGAMLAIKTVKAAMSVAAGKAAAGGCVSAAALKLAEEAMSGLLGTKGTLVVMAMTCGLVAGGLGLAGHSGRFESSQPTRPVKTLPPTAKIDQGAPPVQKAAPPATDLFGDILPPGAVNRLGSIRFRHGAGIAFMTYTPDGKGLVTLAGDRFIRLWDAKTGQLLWRSQSAIDASGIERNRLPLAVRADGKKLGVLGPFAYVTVTTESGDNVISHDLVGGVDDVGVLCGAIAPDLATLAHGCSDGTVRLYEAETGKEKLRIPLGEKVANPSLMPRNIEFASDGKTIYVTVAGNRPFEPDVMWFDTMTDQREMRVLVGARGVVSGRERTSGLVISRDSRLVAAMVTPDPNKKKEPDRVIVCDGTTGKLKYAIEPAAVVCLAFSPDNTLLAISTRDQGIVLIDTGTGKEQRRLQSHVSAAARLAFAPDGKTLAVASNSGGGIALWDVATGQILPPLPEPGVLTHGLNYLPEGKQLLSFGFRDGLYWWDVGTGRLVRHLTLQEPWSPWGQSVSKDGMLVATVLDKDKKSELVLLDSATGKVLRTLKGHRELVFASAFSPDGTKLYSAGGQDPRVLVWDVATGKLLRELKGHDVFVTSLAVSPDGRWLASWANNNAYGADFDIRLWDTATGKLARRLTPRHGRAMLVIFSADGSRVASVGGYQSDGVSVSTEAEVWDVATGKEVQHFSTGSGEHLGCAAITADGRTLATGGGNASLRLWEIATGRERRQIKGHESYIQALDFAPNGWFLAAASAEAPIYIWDVYGRQSRPAAAAKLAKADREKLWQSLSDTDAGAAFQAVCELIFRPAEAVLLLEDGWKKLPRATSQQMRQWIQELNSDQFAVRKNATAELERFATGHEDLLYKALQETDSLEMRQRLEAVLRRLDPERLRSTRMLEILERLGTSQSRQFLQVLAAQTEDAELAREAARGLKRLKL